MECINIKHMPDNDFMVTLEYMDDYIDDIECRVSQGRLPPEDMRIVERYKEFKQYEKAFKKVDFKKLMRQLVGQNIDFIGDLR